LIGELGAGRNCYVRRDGVWRFSQPSPAMESEGWHSIWLAEPKLERMTPASAPDGAPARQPSPAIESEGW
jgi:hypothetical protein